MKTTLAPLVPARAGTQGQVECYSNLDPRFRGGERTLSQRFGGNLRLVSIALMSALASLIGMPSARAQERGPLNLARASYFFVGGLAVMRDRAATAIAGLERIVRPAAAATLRLSICARLISPSSSLRQNSTSWCS